MMDTEEKVETLVVDESRIDLWIQEKCHRIDKQLNELFANKEEDKKTTSFLYPEITCILKTDNRIKPRISESGSDIEVALDCYQDIIAKINRHTVLVPEIENFCSFMGWTSKKLKQMCDSTDEEIREAMDMVDDYLFACQMSAGQSGLLKGNLTRFRTQLVGSHGQGLVTAKESSDINKNTKQEKSPEQLMKEFEMLGFKTGHRLPPVQHKAKK